MISRSMVVLLCLSATTVSAQEPPEAFPVAVSENASNVLGVRDGELAGLAAPLYRCVFERTGLDFTFVEMPLARALFNFEHGEVAVVVPLAQSEARDLHGVFAGPLIDVQYMLLSPHEMPSIEAIEGMVRIPANVTGHSGDRDRFAHGRHAGVGFVL